MPSRKSAKRFDYMLSDESSDRSNNIASNMAYFGYQHIEHPTNTNCPLCNHKFSKGEGVAIYNRFRYCPTCVELVIRRNKMLYEHDVYLKNENVVS